MSRARLSGFVRAVAEVAEDLAQQGPALLGGHVGEFDLEQGTGASPDLKTRSYRSQSSSRAACASDSSPRAAGLIEPAPDAQPRYGFFTSRFEQVETRRQPVEVRPRPGGSCGRSASVERQDQLLDPPAEGLVDARGR